MPDSIEPLQRVVGFCPECAAKLPFSVHPGDRCLWMVKMEDCDEDFDGNEISGTVLISVPSVVLFVKGKNVTIGTGMVQREVKAWELRRP